MVQTRRRLGQDCGITLCHCWRADHRTAGAGHRQQFQLLLSPRNGSGGDAEPEL
uniref:GH03046p n=1 Tax=Drosophila melanogaster TaxID=7227 RepID=Q95SS6_DROME|nr:GH03046p [Drosophila melanogaster]